MKIIEIFHCTLPSQPVFTCLKSIIKTERHCAKYAQSQQERHQFKCVEQMYAHFLLFWLLSILWICHFHYQLVSFLPLYLSFHFDSHSDSPHFSHFQPVPRIPGRFQTTAFSSYSSFSHPYSTHSPHSIP